MVLAFEVFTPDSEYVGVFGDELAGVLVTAIPALAGGTGLLDELPPPIIYLHEEISRIKVYPAGVEEIIDTVAIR